MRPFRAFGPSFRIVIAVLFGFMSLAHGPVMAFAQQKAPQAQHQPAAHHTTQHVQHASHQIQHTAHHGMQAAKHGHHYSTAASICYASSCFVAVAPILVGAPVNIASLLQQLRPAVAHAIVPAELDPSVPPPRLQA